MVSHAHPSARQLRVNSAQATLGPLAVWSQIQAKPLKPSSAWMLPFPESWAACCLVAQSRPTLCNPIDCSTPGSSVHGDSPGKNTGVGCHFPLQWIFLTLASSPQTMKPPRHRQGREEGWGGMAVPLAATGASGPSWHTGKAPCGCAAQTLSMKGLGGRPKLPKALALLQAEHICLHSEKTSLLPAHPRSFSLLGSSSRAFPPVVLPFSHRLVPYKPAPTLCSAHPGG